MNILNITETANRVGYSNTLTKDDIIKEFVNMIDMLDIISEKILEADVSSIPVYKVSNSNIDSSVSESSLELIEEFNFIQLKDKLMTGIKQIKDKHSEKKKEQAGRAISNMIKEANRFADSTTNLKKLQNLVSIHTRNLNLIVENEKKFKNSSAEEQKKTIRIYNIYNIYGKGKDHTASDVLKDINDTKKCYSEIIRIYNKRIKELESYENESYFVDFDSLLSLSEGLDIGLYESIELIKETNNITEDISIFLNDNFNKQFTVNEFYYICDTLYENDINIAWGKEILYEEFINESSLLEFSIGNKSKEEKISSVKKAIIRTEKDTEKLVNELNRFENMSETKKKIYMGKVVLSDFAKFFAITLINPIPANAAGTNAVIDNLPSSYKPSTSLTPKQYIRFLNDGIKSNKRILGKYNRELNRLKK